MDTEAIKQLILEGLPDAQVAVRSGDGVHFEALVISPAFGGKRTIERHRMVYETLGDRMGDEIHALSLSTLTPDEQTGSGQG